MLRYERRADALTRFPRPEGMAPALHALLCARGVASAEEAREFLNPGPGSLHDPFLLNDMSRAVTRIRAALEGGETICVYGDYDVDGVSASAILSEYLKDCGADARVYLPSRHSEGYGLNEAAIREIAGWAKLMVTVDCGVTSVELVALAKSLGLDVIVTDHHQPAETLPDCPVVNPLLAGYPFPYLCGAGVAWKLVQALSGSDAMDRVDIAALATVADVVSLTGENRAIVRMGLEAINRAPRLGIAKLIEAAGIQGRRIEAGSIGFQLAPRLNAGGRLGSAMRALELLTAKDPARAEALAAELNGENETRRNVERRILFEAEEQLAGFDFPAHRAIILAGKDWNPGVIGLAASRLVEKYHYPTILLADQGDKLTGSCRSIEGVDIHAALTGCAQYMTRFGGHRQAAGLTMEPDKLQPFRDAMDAWLTENVDASVYIPVEKYDAEIGFDQVDAALITALEDLQPTGFGNPGALFRAKAEVLEARAIGADGAHLKLTLTQGDRELPAIAFGQGAWARRAPDALDVLFTPKFNTYNGVTSTQLEVRALRDGDVFGRIDAKVPQESSLQCNFLTEILYNRTINRYDGTPIAVDAAAVRGWLEESPQGTLILAADFASARAALEGMGTALPEVFIGALPEDPRGFNALCVCAPLAALPAGYRRAVLAGMPTELLPGDMGGELFRLDMPVVLGRDAPDLEALRAAYLALMRVSQRPVYCAGMAQLAHLVGEEAGLSRLTALMAMLAMADMGLFIFDFTARPTRIRRVGAKKVAPETSALWRAMQTWMDRIR